MNRYINNIIFLGGILIPLSGNFSQAMEIYLNQDREIKSIDFSSSEDVGGNELHVAAAMGQLDLVKSLLEQNNDLIKEVTVGGYNALHLASKHGHLDVVRFLFDKKKGLLYESNNKGQNPFHVASENGRLDIVEFFYNKNKRIINMKSDANENALILSSIYGHLNVFEFLFRKKPILIMDKNTSGLNAILGAAKFGQLHIIEFIYKERKDLLKTWVDQYDCNALHIACHFEKIDVIKFLIHKYPDMIKTKDFNKSNVLHISARNGSVEICEFLIPICPELLNEKDKASKFPYHYALDKKQMELAKSMISAQVSQAKKINEIRVLEEKITEQKSPPQSIKTNTNKKQNEPSKSKKSHKKKIQNNFKGESINSPSISSIKKEEKSLEVKETQSPSREEFNLETYGKHQHSLMVETPQACIEEKKSNAIINQIDTCELKEKNYENLKETDAPTPSLLSSIKQENSSESMVSYKPSRKEPKGHHSENSSTGLSSEAQHGEKIKEEKKTRFKLLKPSTWRDTRDEKKLEREEKKKLKEEKKEKRNNRNVAQNSDGNIGEESSLTSTSCADSDSKSHFSISISESEMSESFIEPKEKTITFVECYKSDTMRHFYPKLYSYINKSGSQHISQLHFKNDHLIKKILINMCENNLVDLTEFNINKNGAKINVNMVGNPFVKFTVHATHGSGAYEKWYYNPDIVVSFFEFITKCDPVISDFLKIHFGEYCFSRDLTIPMIRNNSNDHCGDVSKGC